MKDNAMNPLLYEPAVGLSVSRIAELDRLWRRVRDEERPPPRWQEYIVSPVGASVMAVASVDAAQLFVNGLDLDNVAVAPKSLPWWRDRRTDLYKPLV
jgi:hypothetical protein